MRVSGLAEAGGCGRGHGETAHGPATPFPSESCGGVLGEELYDNSPYPNRLADPVPEKDRNFGGPIAHQILANDWRDPALIVHRTR